MDKQIRKIKVENKVTNISTTIFCLIFANILLIVLIIMCRGSYFLTFIMILSLLFLLWRFSIIKYFMLESSGEVLSIKYHHPFVYKKSSNLEVPLTKVTFSKIEKGLFSHFFKIHIRKGKDEKRYMLFYYHLQGLSTKQKQTLKEFVEENYYNTIIESK